MYLKLALRNAKRSLVDYLLYISTVTILVFIMCVSNCIATFASMEAGFQTVSLPLLIVLIMVILMEYINSFIMILFEFIVIGAACFILGVLLGVVILHICFLPALKGTTVHLNYIVKGIMQTFGYFCMVGLLSVYRMKQKLCKLQINQLMSEKHRNQPHTTSKKSFWGTLLIGSFFSFIMLLFGIVFLPDTMVNVIISLILLPALCCIFAFYKWLYAFFATKRLSQSYELYKGNRLYQIAEMTTGTNTSANINTVFSASLLLSTMSLVTGIFMLSKNTRFFTPENQRWMGFMQISICIIFMVIYFSTLSFLQIIELKRQAKNIQILHYMGKHQAELTALIKTQIRIKLCLPTLMCFALLAIATPLINHRLNILLPMAVNNLLLISIGGFTVCFIILYICYFYAIYVISRHYIQQVLSVE